MPQRGHNAAVQPRPGTLPGMVGRPVLLVFPVVVNTPPSVQQDGGGWIVGSSPSQWLLDYAWISRWGGCSGLLGEGLGGGGGWGQGRVGVEEVLGGGLVVCGLWLWLGQDGSPALLEGCIGCGGAWHILSVGCRMSGGVVGRARVGWRGARHWGLENGFGGQLVLGIWDGAGFGGFGLGAFARTWEVCALALMRIGVWGSGRKGPGSCGCLLGGEGSWEGGEVCWLGEGIG